MQDLVNRELSFGEVLDVSFNIIKTHCLKFFALLLIFFGPFYILQTIIKFGGSPYLLRDPNVVASAESLLGTLAKSSLNLEGTQLGIYLLLTLVMGVFAVPVAYAAMLLMVRQIRYQGDAKLGECIKLAFKRYFPTMGSVILYYFIFTAWYIALFIVAFLYLLIIIGPTMLRGASPQELFTSPSLAIGIGFGIIFLVFMVLLMIISTRFGMFLPAVVYNHDFPGLGKSWRMTKGRIWRVVGIFTVSAIIAFTISGSLHSLAALFLGQSLLASILMNVFNMFMSIALLVTFAVTYFDLQLRSEAIDLKILLANNRKQNQPILNNNLNLNNGQVVV